MAGDTLVGADGLPLSAEVLERLLASSQDVLYAVALNPVHMLYATPAFARRMGLPEDFLRRGFHFAEYLESIHPDDQARVATLMDAIVASRSDAELPENPGCYRLRRPEGGWRAIADHYSVLRDADGVPHTLIGNARDMSERDEALQALAENEARFRSLAENSRDVFFTFRLPEGRYEFISAKVEDILGHAPQEFYDDPGLFMRCVAPQWREIMAAWNAEIATGKVRDKYEFQVLDGQGRLRWLVERLELVPAPDGQGMMLQGVAADITEEREARENLHRSEEHYRQLAEGWLDQVVIRMNLRTARYEYVSAGMERIFGFAPEMFYRGERGMVGRTVAPEWRAEVQVWLAEARAGVLRPEYEYELIDAWGRRRWVHQRCTLLRDADGNPEVLQGVLFDNSEHKRLEAELAASERKYRTLHESMRDGFAAVDMDGVIVEHNNAFREMLGYTSEEIARLTYRDITPERWHDAEARILADQVFPRGYSDVFEKEYRRKDGTAFPVSLRVYREDDDAGDPRGLWAVVRDISEQKRVEMALRESEARFRLIVETASEGIWTVDAHERATFVNVAMARMLGYRVEEMLVAKTQDFLFPEDLEHYARQIAERRAGKDEIYERRFRRKDGTTLWVLASAKPILDAEGRFDGAFAMFVDITEQKRAQEALRASERRFSELIRYSSDSITILDAEGVQVFVSEAAERMLGFSPAELMGIPVITEMIHPEDREEVAEAFGRVLREGMAGVQYRHRHKDGSWVIIEAWGTNQLNNPDIRGIVVNARDITERKLVEDALRQSEERYALALKGANDGLWDWDLVKDQVYYSDRWKEIIGYDPEEIRHDVAEWTSRIHPEDFERVMAANQECIRGETPVFQVEYRLRHKDGSYRWIYGRGASLADATGRVVRLAGAHSDITARRQAEEALFRNERLSRKLLESMHEGIWAVDANRRTTFVNDRLCDMLGYASAELMNMSPTDVLEWPQRNLAQNQVPDFEAGFSRATDYVLIRKDGTRFPAHVVSSPVMEAQGRFEGLVCGVVDLTERARMEHELRRNQARFEALYELSRLMPATEHQLAAFTLREAIRLTDSTAGVLFFVSADGQCLEPKAWETGEFNAAGHVPSFPTSGPLPWATVLQSGLPLLVNDFSECARMVPPGHPEVRRFLGVPALDGARPVAVLGLMGKDEPYVPEDTLQTTLLLDGMWREVRTRRDAERIRSSLREKEALLHEVHHRVKNNLQVISSLMDMAGRRLASDEARQSLRELRGKVLAMSLIHAQLHGAGSGGGISLERFVRALFNQLREVYAGGLELSLELKLGRLDLSLDQAVPLGLALNETLTNIFKHACPPVDDGACRASRVEIRAGLDAEGRVRIEVEDNGPGLPEGLSPDTAESLGLKLMRGLVRHQLRGELTFADARPGVCVGICFQPHVRDDKVGS